MIMLSVGQANRQHLQLNIQHSFNIFNHDQEAFHLIYMYDFACYDFHQL